MRAAATSHLVPGRWDDLTRRLAPAWSSTDLGSGSVAGTGWRLLRPCLWLLVTAVAVQSLLHVVNVAAFDLQIDRFNADTDGSVAGWLGTVTTWSAACGAMLLALLAPGLRVPLLLLAALSAFLSLDDMLVLHEIVARLALRYDTFGHSGYTLWPMVYLPLLSVVGWLLLRSARSVDVTTGRVLVAGLACLAAAVALEASAPVLYALGSDHGKPLYESEVTVEEALETLGWGLLALGLIAAALDLLLARGAAQAPLLVGSVSKPASERLVAHARSGSEARQPSFKRAVRADAPGAPYDPLRSGDRRSSGDRRGRRRSPLDY